MKKAKVALIASGGGTDAFSIMNAFDRGDILNIELKLLISTKKGAGCLEKAAYCNIPAIVIDRKEVGSSEAFNRELKYVLVSGEIELVFLVGCIAKIEPIDGIAIYNIHPADLEKFGGKGMYGLEPHKKVLLGVQDLIERGRKTAADRFYTEPTVHKVNDKYDSGEYLLKLNLEIPGEIIANFMENPSDIEGAAKRLQEYVLPYEWRMLPLAVKLAAAKVLENNQVSFF